MCKFCSQINVMFSGMPGWIDGSGVKLLTKATLGTQSYAPITLPQPLPHLWLQMFITTAPMST